MADISKRISRKSIKAKKKYAIKTIKKQAKEKIHDIKIQYAANPERQQEKDSEKQHKRTLRIQRRNARLAYYAKQPRPFTVGEEISNSIIHGIAAGLSIAAIVLLAVRAYFYAPAGMDRSSCVASFVIFGSMLFITYTMSTLYHALTPYGARKVFSIFDHDAIYLMLAGTYTPFLLLGTKSHTGMLIATIWAVTAVLIALYSVFGSKLRTFSFFTYFLIGWILVAAVLCGQIEVTQRSQNFMLAGAIVYSLGCGFFILRKFKWTHSMFHLFSLAASVLHFFSVYFLV